MPGPSPRSTPASSVAPARTATVSPEGSETVRLRALFEAQRAINSDLSLKDVLGRIVRAACELVGADYGALGVLGPDDRLEQFVHHGMPDHIVREVGALPTGKGLLGVLIDDPSPVQLGNLGADPRSVGFSRNHPPMTAFLAIPIRVRGEVFGDIYLCNAEQGTFTDADEELLTAFAETAGTAINNARLYEDARRSRDWLHASGEITRALLADVDADTLLEVVSRALNVAEADFGALVLPEENGTLMRTVVAVGLGAETYAEASFDPSGSELARILTSGQSALINDIGALDTAWFDNEHGFGPLMIAPLVDAEGLRGSVVLIRAAGNPAFTRRDLDLASNFADQVALALEMDEARNDAEQLRVLEVRHRIAEDLHDNVMQRLFATGMGLQGLARSALPTTLSDRLGKHITDLDDTIDEIRERVFGLRGETLAVPGRVRARFPHVHRPAASPAIDAGDEDELDM